MDTTIIIKLAVAGRNLLKYLPFLAPEDPQVIREKYNTHLVAKVRKKYGSPKVDSKGNVPREERMRAWANWYHLRAQILWGRPDPRQRHRSAWLYVTAAQLYEDGKALSQAQDCYHFAAHGFCELDSLAQAFAEVLRAGGRYC